MSQGDCGQCCPGAVSGWLRACPEWSSQSHLLVQFSHYPKLLLSVLNGETEAEGNEITMSQGIELN